MKRFAALILTVWFSAAHFLEATELIRNGGFERPISDDLSRVFEVDHHEIPEWEFSNGVVSLINHTRLLPGEGFQCILLPVHAGDSAAIQQKFNLAAAGSIRLAFKVAASKAQEGEIQVTLDGHTIKLLRFSEFWKPEEMALTDQMKWRAVEMPEIQTSSGEHILRFRVLNFQARSDRQGDTRENVQGLLIDAVSVQCRPFEKAGNGKDQRQWPAEKKVVYQKTKLLPLDGVAGPWVATATLACYPALANFSGALRSTKEMGGLQYLHFTQVGSPGGVLNSISLDGQPIFCDESRWYPYQLRTRSQAGPLDVESTTRMVFNDHGVLNKFTFTNRSDAVVSRTLEMNLQSGKAIERRDGNVFVIPGNPGRAYLFTLVPDQIITTNGETQARWTISIKPRTSLEISYAMALEKDGDFAFAKVKQWGGNFTTAFAAAHLNWEDRWQAVFHPGNTVYSGCLPTLETEDQNLRELYYLSIVSLLGTERDNFPEFKQCFVGEDPEWGGDVTWFWDYSLTSLPYALLNPAVMKDELRHWLTIDWRACSHFSLRDGRADGNWYAVNPYAYFLSLDRYLTVTGDFAFLTEKMKEQTVLAWLENLALDWQRLVPQNGKLADIGGNCWNMLEAPPNYVHTVASINAANIWMMRRLADYQDRAGHATRAAQLRAEARALVPELLKLYNPNTGSWNVRYPNGQQVDSRHVYDYLTVGTTIPEDLGPDIKTGMINFVERELMTPTWMRAMSRDDPSAFDSDRSDHGPAGSYTGWPAKAAQATAELGRFDKSADWLRRFRQAFTAAIPQAIELTKVEGQAGLQARVSTRAGASFAEVSGSFAEVIINTSFGFRPAPDGKSALWEPQIPRGFHGSLHHVRWNNNLYSIISDDHGLHLENE